VERRPCAKRFAPRPAEFFSPCEESFGESCGGTLDTHHVAPDTVTRVLPSVTTHESRRATQVTLKAVVLLASVLFVVFSISFIFSDRGLPELQHARTRVAELHANIGRLETENARLRAEIESVKKSSYAIERIAREDLGMSRKGETVYMLPKK
jgi:cell division protein FtsB